MTTHEITIVGGGISGLSLAHYCAEKGLSVVILEREGSAGGCIRTHRTADHFWIEQGAHTLYNSYEKLLKLLIQCGLATQVIPHKRFPYRMLSSRKVHSIALSLSWSELGFSLPGACLLNKKKMSAKEYFAGLVGRGNFERVVSPMLNASVLQDADDFPAALVFRRRPHQKGFPGSFTLPGGLQTLPEALVRHPKIRFVKNTEVQTIHYEEGFVLKTKTGEVFRSPYCAIATHPADAAKFLKTLDQKIAAHLSEIPIKTIESTTFFAPAQEVPFPFSAGVIPLGNNYSETNQQFSFFSAISRDVVLPTPSTLAHFRGFTFHFRPGRLDLESQIQCGCEVLHLRREKTEVISTTHSMPTLRLGHADWVKEIDQLIQASPLKSHLLLTGNYFQGLTIEDCITRSTSEFRRIFEIVTP